MDIIEKIRQYQYQRDWTDYKLAQEAGIPYNTLAAVFLRNTPPKLETLQCICNAFGLTLAQFFLEDESIEVISGAEKQLLQSFRKLSIQKQQSLLSLIQD